MVNNLTILSLNGIHPTLPIAIKHIYKNNVKTIYYILIFGYYLIYHKIMTQTAMVISDEKLDEINHKINESLILFDKIKSKSYLTHLTRTLNALSKHFYYKNNIKKCKFVII